MKLSKKLKVALDETRMTILGAQVLFGFEFRVVFQETFGQLPALWKATDLCALLLLLIAISLLILPGPYHRIVEGGNASTRMTFVAGNAAAWSLLPFSGGIALSVALSCERIWSPAAGALAGAPDRRSNVACWREPARASCSGPPGMPP